MRVLFYDTETTGGGERDRLIQLAVKERGVQEPVLNALYTPAVPISIGAMAVHHITPKMLAGRPAFDAADEYARIKGLFEHEESVGVAHNASFDLGMLAKEQIVPRQTICTYKVAKALDGAGRHERHSLQHLRYSLGLEIEAVAHDAWGDVLVLEAIFESLFKDVLAQEGSEEAALKEMIRISAEPILFTTMHFGKYKGKLLKDIAAEDPSYLKWLLGVKKQEPDGQEDLIYTLEYYLQGAEGQPATPF